MLAEISAYMDWLGESVSEEVNVMIVQEKDSVLDIKDADSDVLFHAEENALIMEEYRRLKALALK